MLHAFSVCALLVRGCGDHACVHSEMPNTTGNGKKRQRAIDELLHTESAYVKDLGSVQTGYIEAIPDSVL